MTECNCGGIFTHADDCPAKGTGLAETPAEGEHAVFPFSYTDVDGDMLWFEVDDHGYGHIGAQDPDGHIVPVIMDADASERLASALTTYAQLLRSR